MRRGARCPVCHKVWVYGGQLGGRRPEGVPETCPDCPGVLLVAVYDYEEDGRWRA